jgi:hypothetical protein
MAGGHGIRAPNRYRVRFIVRFVFAQNAGESPLDYGVGGFASMLNRLTLRVDVLREFAQHLRADRHRRLWILCDLGESVDGIAI